MDRVLHDHYVASLTTPELNWSGTYTYAAQQIHRPRSIAELQRLVETASSSLHVLGTRHSFNDIADAAGLPTRCVRRAFHLAAGCRGGQRTRQVDRGSLEAIPPKTALGKGFGEGHQWPELYPQLADFRRLAETYDPRGVFRNPYLSRTILGPAAP
jgi:hypothetical protein